MDVNSLKKVNDDQISDTLQKWIIWNHENGLTASSINCYFNSLRSYFWHIGIRLDWHNLRRDLKFPKTLHKYETPISRSHIEQLLKHSKQDFRFQMLALISSGVRVGELGQITPDHLDMSRTNIMVRIPPEITKTGMPRITFFSRQVSEMIRHKLDKEEDTPIFCGIRDPEQAVNLVLKRFASARRKADMMQRHQHCSQNRYHIHVHSLRAYFITKCNRVQFGLGHILAGHNFYMRQYNQYTEKELHDMYVQAESELTFRRTKRSNV